MPAQINRRQALRLLAAVAGACSLDPLPALSAPKPKRLGLCSISYWLRWPSVTRGRGTRDEWLQFIDHCHRAGAGGIQTSLPADPTLTATIRDKVESCGMYLEGQVGLPRPGVDLDPFDSQVRAAKETGATVVRTACLGGRRYESFTSLDAFKDFTRQSERSLAAAEPILRRHKIRLAVENHKDWRVPELVGLLERISSEFIGVCVDTGNSIALLEDPIAVVEAYAPYALSVHLKDMGVKEYEKGFLLSEVPLGDGFLDLRAIVAMLRRARPEIQFSLEMITRDPLQIPCLTPPFWTTFEGLSGRFLAETLAMVRENTSKQPLPQVTGLSPEERLELEDSAVKKSIAYAGNHLPL